MNEEPTGKGAIVTTNHGMAFQQPKELSVSHLKMEELEYDAKLLDYHIQQAKMLCKVEFVPADYKGKEANALFAIQMGHHVGLSPTQSLQTIAVINGKAALYGDGLLAAVRGSGLCEWIKEDVEPGVSATCTTLRKGEKDPVSRTFTMELAEKAGLISRAKERSPWKSYPDRMMQMRARAWCLRDVYADALMGIQSAEEIKDIELVEEVTPEVDLEPKHAEVTQLVDEKLEKKIVPISVPEAGLMLANAKSIAELIKLGDELKQQGYSAEQNEILHDAYKTRRDTLKEKS